jgi:hypothetical protein
VRADRGWKRPLEDPIPLPRGRQLITLKDAADYIPRLPRAEHERPEWPAAIAALMMAAEDRGPLMHARIGVMRAPSRRAGVRSRPEGHALGTPEADAGSATQGKTQIISKDFLISE